MGYWLFGGKYVDLLTGAKISIIMIKYIRLRKYSYSSPTSLVQFYMINYIVIILSILAVTSYSLFLGN